MTIIPKTRTSLNDVLRLDSGDRLLLRQGVSITAVNEGTVQAEGRNIRMDIDGSLAGELALSAVGRGLNIDIGKTGQLFGVGVGIGIFGSGQIVNRGDIVSASIGIGGQLEPVDTLKIVNHGRIIAPDQGVAVQGAGTITLINHGRIVTKGTSVLLGDQDDRFVNSGHLVGAVNLGDGDDLYDGFAGTNGPQTGIFGLSGNDRMRPGLSRETMFGDDGNDILDFGGQRAVRLDLTGATENTGAAKGDSYNGFEIILGSARADRIKGNGLDMTLNGRGGNDRLESSGGNMQLLGGEGDDRLIGGADDDSLTGGVGQDVLTGGAGLDIFIFHNSSEGGDQITDMASEDRIHLSVSGFGGGLVAGAMDPNRFVSGINNRAVDADDRLIFRSTDATLWFDRDGTGTKFRPQLIADLQDGFSLITDNITLF